MAFTEISQNKKIPDTSCIKDLREARAGFEPAVKVLQTSALPLGYHATYHKGAHAVGRFLMISKHVVLTISNSPSRARTYNNSVNSRVLYH